MVSLDPFRPKEVTAEDKNVGSLDPTLTTEMISEVTLSHQLHQKEWARDASECNACNE